MVDITLIVILYRLSMINFIYVIPMSAYTLYLKIFAQERCPIFLKITGLFQNSSQFFGIKSKVYKWKWTVLFDILNESVFNDESGQSKQKVDEGDGMRHVELLPTVKRYWRIKTFQIFQ